MSWKCLQCGEHIEDELEACWKCGTRVDGEVDPDFQHADEFEPPLLPPEKPQFRLSGLMLAVTAFCLLFGAASVIINGRFTFWGGFVCLGGMASLAAVFLWVVAVILTRWVAQRQREIRADAQHRRTGG